MRRVVVAEEYHVEAVDKFCNALGVVFAVIWRDDSAVPTAVEKSHHKVGFLLFANHLDPLAGTLYHVLETQSGPKLRLKPVGNSRGKQSYDCHSQPPALYNSVWMKTRLACLHINNVGSKQRTASFGYPFIIDPLACFNVVIAYCLRIVTKIVYYLGCDISRQRINKIIVVVQGLSLQYVAVVEKNHIVAVFLAQIAHIRSHPSHRATRLVPAEHIDGEEVSVDIACFDQMQCDCFLL